MSSYAWKTNRHRSSKLVIIYMGFLLAIFVVGFIFLWNSMEGDINTDDISRNSAAATSTFSIKTVQTLPQQQPQQSDSMEERLKRISMSPLFWLLIVGFALIALQITYTFNKFDRKRARKYDELYKILEKYESPKPSSREVMIEEIEEIDYRIEQIGTEMRNIDRDIYYDNITDNEAEARRNELQRIQRDLFFKRDNLQHIYQSNRQKSLELLRNEMQNLMTSD